jgi:hypothetical protein
MFSLHLRRCAWGSDFSCELVGGAKEYPPNDEAGFLEFARSLRTPLLYETIREAEPLTAISSFRSTESAAPI